MLPVIVRIRLECNVKNTQHNSDSSNIIAKTLAEWPGGSVCCSSGLWQWGAQPAQPGPAAESKQRERVEGEGGDRGKHSRQVNGKTPKVNIGLNR